MAKDWIDTLARKARDRGDAAQAEKLKSGWNQGLIDYVTHRGVIPDHLKLAQVTQTVRNLQSLAKLGSVTLSSLPDLAISAATLRWNGVPLFERWGELLATPFLGRRAGATRQIADELGVGLDTLRAQVLSRFTAADGLPGKGAKLVQTMHRINLLGYWTDSMKTTVALIAARNLAKAAGREFAALDSRLQITLRRFGIEQPEWDALRQAELRAGDGRRYMVPGSMLALPDDAIAHLAPQDATPRQLDQIREDLKSKLGTFISEQAREALTEPTAGDRRIATFGTHAGTVSGELIRTLLQFKQFSFTLVRRSLNREWNRGESKDIGGLASLIVTTTLLGYAAMTLKDLAQGKNPQQPQKVQDYADLIGAAMQQGGGLGIYGDYLLGEYNRFGQSFAETAAGPAIGSVLNPLGKMFATLRSGSNSSRTDRGDLLAREGMQALKSNTPFINLFYTRMALDYLILYGLQEAVNPGYLRRYERRMQRENNQTFWLRPTEAVRY